MKLGKPIKYIAVKPEEVVERVKKYIHAGAKSKVKRLDELKGGDVLKELELLHKQGIEFIEPTDLSGAIRGRHNLYTHLEMMIKNANESVVLVTTNKGILRKVDALKGELKKLNKKGVDIRIAAPFSKESKNALKDMMKVGSVRNIDKKDMNARFCIVDGKELMFMVLDDDEVHPTYDIGVWINTPYFAGALNSMFDVAWNNLEDGEKVLSKL